MHILEALAAGQGVTLIPESAELTTVQAADVLNVSRPFLIKLLDQKVIPHRKVGRHRRIRMEDVMAYKDAIDREREQVLDQLTREGPGSGHGIRPSVTRVTALLDATVLYPAPMRDLFPRRTGACRHRRRIGRVLGAALNNSLPCSGGLLVTA